MRKVFKIILLNLYLLSFFNLHSEPVETKYSQIRELIDRNKTSEAQDALKPLLESDPDNPTLNLYQTEIWIIRGEDNYHSGNLKSAYDYFTKAQTTWASHPTVRNRIAELQGKKLVDRPKNISKARAGQYLPEVQNKNTLIVLADPEILELTDQLKDRLRFRIAELEQTAAGLNLEAKSQDQFQKWMIVLLGISLLINLLLSIQVFGRK